jgi:hypothetical protein
MTQISPNAHGSIALQLALATLQAVLRRQHFKNGQWRVGDDLLSELVAVKHRHIGNPETCGADLDPQLGSYAHVPISRMLSEPNGFLPCRMVVFPHGSFLDLPIHVLCVGLLGGA